MTSKTHLHIRETQRADPTRGDAAAPARALAYAAANRVRHVDELMQLIRFPTVGGQAVHAPDMRRCAHWLASHLRTLGLTASLVSTTGHPFVLAEWRGAATGLTVLIYGHYDVQPAEPLDAWTTPPFVPTVRGRDLYGRGACDDKGQLWAHVKALECWIRTSGCLPVNVICVLEGEEESGSRGLLEWLGRHGPALGVDAAVISDMPMRRPGVPAITYGLRGTLGIELEVRAGDTDLHSGLFGGAVANPLQVLAEIIDSLHDSDRRIAIANFYDRVQRSTAGERAYLARHGPSDAELLTNARRSVGLGEHGWSAFERVALRPSLSVNGISGGYAGEGVKAVIPVSASAKFSFRLVPNQNPGEVDRLFRAHVARLAPPGVQLTVRTAFGARPVLIHHSHPVVRAAAAAAAESFGRAPVLLRSGGTIPVVSHLVEELKIPTALLGFASPDDGMHAPNEKFHLPNLFRGIASSIRLLARLGRMSRNAGDYGARS